MSILFINSSPNKNGNTAKVAAELLSGREYETLNLTDYKIYGYGQQFEDDQFMEVIEKIRQADTIVIGSPLYWHNLSGILRCFLDRNMLLQAFADGGWYERKGVGGYRNDHPVGLGIGFSFDSKAGLLSLNYAVAAHDGQGFRLRAAKVCVGYSAVF